MFNKIYRKAYNKSYDLNDKVLIYKNNQNGTLFSKKVQCSVINQCFVYFNFI